MNEQYKAPEPQEIPPIYTEQKKKLDYSTRETVGAFTVLLLAFLFCRSFPFVSSPLGCFTVCVLTLICTAIYIKLKKAPSPAPLTYMFLAFSALLCAVPLLTSNLILLLISYVLFFVFLLIFLFFRHKNGTGAPSSEYIFYDCLDVFVELPLFSSGGAKLFSAMIHPLRKGRFKAVGKQIGYILLGILLTLIPTYIVLSNLSYDSGFTDILSDIFGFDGMFSLVEYVISLLFAIPIAIYFYGSVWQYQERCNSDGQQENVKAAHQSSKQSLKLLPAISVITAAIPLMFLYVVFFISQKENYTSAFSGVLPDGFIYSEYARQGFFELCKVAGLNAVFIFTAHVFTKNAPKGVKILQKAVTAALSLCSLCLIATALSKMLLYIDAYGMTQKRVYVSLFMILMAVGFVFTLAAQLVSRIKMTWVCLVLSVLMLIIPAYANIDGVIASYNVDRYINGTLDTLDYVSLDPVAAMPALEKLYNSGKASATDITFITTNAEVQHSKHERLSALSFNIPSYNAYRSAERILAKQG